ncbi:MAG: hypothetical protein ACMG6E_02445, partial [Candidatus Roizmanbacteria bacterium]
MKEAETVDHIFKHGFPPELPIDVLNHASLQKSGNGVLYFESSSVGGHIRTDQFLMALARAARVGYTPNTSLDYYSLLEELKMRYEKEQRGYTVAVLPSITYRDNAKIYSLDHLVRRPLHVYPSDLLVGNTGMLENIVFLLENGLIDKKEYETFWKVDPRATLLKQLGAPSPREISSTSALKDRFKNQTALPNLQSEAKVALLSFRTRLGGEIMEVD